MILGRRLPQTIGQRLRGWLWPQNGWHRAGRYLLWRIRRMPGTPHAVAAGFAAGAAMSMTPFLGGHLLLAFGLSYLTGGNLLAAALGTLVGNPWTLPLILAIDYWLGCLTLGQVPQGVHDLAWTEPGVLLEALGGMLRPMTIGSVPLVIAAWVLAYLLLLQAVAAVQEQRRRRIGRGPLAAADPSDPPRQG